jgi:ribosome biogenesis protein BRX1
MAAVYKSLSKSASKARDSEGLDRGDEYKKTRQRVLMLTSRGVNYRYEQPTNPSSAIHVAAASWKKARWWKCFTEKKKLFHRHRHLLADLYSLLPHSRKDAKLDTKTRLQQLNELADLYNCNNVLFFEARKARDLYVWMSKPPNGPTIKFHAANIHTMEELHFTGNCLKGSRPILSFDKAFDGEAHLKVIKEVLLHTFGVPKSSRRIKPFVDHVMGFTVADGKIWIRCYEIKETEPGKEQNNTNGTNGTPKENATAPMSSVSKETNISLVEIGPRLLLTPIVIQESSFGGPIIYENKEFVSPNQVRADIRKARASRYGRREANRTERVLKRGELGLNTEGGTKKPRDALDNRELFA